MPDKSLSPAEIALNRTMVQHLRAWFLHKGLTQEHMANKLDVSQGSLSKWLKGTQSMSVGTFTAMAHILEAEPSALLMPPDRPDEAEAYTRATGILSAMDPDALQQWLAVGEAMTAGRPKKVSSD